jgi:BolA family transcriptional regulator, general stress-responsive regulator
VEEVGKRIESMLREKFQPLHLEVRDESALHAGHAGAVSGGGHFRVLIVSEAFAGPSLVERHRMVYAALGEMIGRDIHALGLRALPPSEWTGAAG